MRSPQLLLAVLAAIAGLANAQAVTGEKARGRLADLDSLTRWVHAEASFSAATRSLALTRIQSIRRGPADDDAAFFLQVASVVALADNGHSNIDRRPAVAWGLLPVRTFWFSDGLYIVRARSDHAALLGTRIDSIAGVGVDELVTRLGVYHGGTDDFFKQYFATEMFLAPRFLHAAGIGDRVDALTLSISGAPAGRERVTVPVQNPAQRPSRTQPWVRLVPVPIDGENGEWRVVNPGALPVSLRQSSQTFRFFEIEPGIAYVQLRSNFDQNGVVLREWASETLSRLRAMRPRAVILDNRYNGGGDLNRASELALALPDVVGPSGNVYVLVSGATFSAGIYTSYFPEAVAPARTLVMGEHVGDRERFWAETRGPVLLPSAGFSVGQSLQLHDVGSGCNDVDVCHLAGRAGVNIAIGSLEPELRIATTFDDYRAGRDPVLDEALRRAREVPRR